MKHTEGVIPLARTPSDGDYAAFGKVVKGMDVVKAIASCAVNGNRPIEKQAIKTATIVDSVPADTNNSEN